MSEDSKLVISFCNSSANDKSLLYYHAESDQAGWCDLNCKEDIVGVSGIVRYREGYFALRQGSGGRTTLMYINAFYEAVKHVPLSLVNDGHSIIVLGNELYIASSGNDSVGKITFDDKLNVREVIEARLSSLDKGDTLHLNSVCSYQGKIYVSAFGNKGDKSWKECKSGVVLSLADRQVIAESIAHPHSLQVFDDCIYWLESKTGVLWEYSKELGLRNISRVNGYARGLVVSARGFVVGISAARSVSKSTGTMNTDYVAGVNDRSYLVFLDKAGVEYFRKDMTDYGTEIFDICF